MFFLHCSPAGRFTLRLFILAALLGSLLTAAAPPVSRALVSGRAEIMPPYPLIEEKILAGQVAAPKSVDTLAPSMARALDSDEPQPVPLWGSLNLLVVLVAFSDRGPTVQPSFYDHLVFDPPVEGRGSVRDYFNEVTHGQVDIVTLNLPSSTGWQTVGQPESAFVGTNYCMGTYPQNCQKLAETVVNAIDGLVDFKKYDNNRDGAVDSLVIVHTGPGAEFTGSTADIWSHSWYLNKWTVKDEMIISRYAMVPEYWGTTPADRKDLTIGVLAHELGHGLWNLPDLYDTDSSSLGIGNWSLMSYGSWNGLQYLGDSPAWPDAYSRILMGYATPIAVTENLAGQSIPEVGAAGTDTIFKLRSDALASVEYYLVENREKTPGSYDEYLPGSGLAIWHVDESNAYAQNRAECTLAPNYLCGATHYEVALVQADGNLDLEKKQNRGDDGDLFPGGTANANWNFWTSPENSSWYRSTLTNIAINNVSVAGPTMTADLQVLPASLPQLTIGGATVVEGNSGTTDATFTVHLSPAGGGPVSVSWATADGTAIAGTDYAAASGVLDFAAGETDKSLTVAVYGDTDVEPDETFFVNLADPSGATIAGGQAPGVIQGDDAPPSPPLPDASVDNVPVTEGNTGITDAVFTVQLSSPAPAGASVAWSTADGTATAGSDYIASSGTLTFAEGATSQTFSVPVTGDTAVEADETFYVNLSGPSGITLAASQGLGTILNDDTSPLPTLAINDALVTEGNSGSTNAVFTVQLSAAPTSPVSVSWSTSDGTATSGTDYRAASGTLTFTGDVTSQTISVPVYGDTAVEGDEAFFINLFNPSNATISDGQGQGVIVNDDMGAPVLHVGDLDGLATAATKGKWNVKVTITVHNQLHALVSGVKVTGNWDGKGTVTCTTGTNGACSLAKTGLTAASITFNVTNAVKAGATYNAYANHDPDGDSTGTRITVSKP